MLPSKPSQRKCKRLEKLMASGVLTSFPQRIKASFDYLDAEGTGFFTLKDLTERGKRVFVDLGIDLDQGPSFSVMDNFRLFDITGKGRVRIEDLSISLLLRFMNHDQQYFEDIASDVISAGFSTSSALVTAIVNSDRSFPNESSTQLPPQSFREAYGGVYYIILNKLNDKSHRLLGDKLTQPGLAKILKETYVEVAKEILFSLHLPFERLKGSWETISQGSFCSIDELKENRNPNIILWKQPKRVDNFGTTRRMSFEMTQASSLKAQARRSSSILGGNESSSRGNLGRNWPDSPVDPRLPRKSVGNSNFHSTTLNLYDQNFNFSQDMIDTPLNSNQVMILKAILRALDNFFVVTNNEGVYDESLFVEDIGDGRERRNSLSLAINRGLNNIFNSNTLNAPEGGLPGQRYSVLGSGGYQSWLTQMQRTGDGGSSVERTENIARSSSGSGNPFGEAELSQELMETQDRLRRTVMRLEVLELIQMQMQDIETNPSPQSTDAIDILEGLSSGNPTEPPLEIPQDVAFEDIMETIQELRILVSKRGMENMVVGSLLAVPTAMLPLQNVEDCQNLSAKSDEIEGKREVKKTLQVSALISKMEKTTESLSNQLTKKADILNELGKWKLSVHMREEKLAEDSIRVEQEQRALENASTVAVEIQVLRDRIHASEYIEKELEKLKNKNVELGRRVKELERELSQAHEEREYGKMEADLRPINENGMTESEELIMKLKDEINELKTANSRLVKEQQHRSITAKHAEQRLKMTLQDNLSLHQKLNRIEEELNSSKTEVSDLLGQIEHQRDVEEERLQVSKKLHTTEMLVTELRANLLEARAEASQAVKLREELNLCESRVAKLIAAASEAEIEGESRLTSKQEIDELRQTLQQKTREIRELTLKLKSYERKSSEIKTIQNRLEQCQEEMNRYKIKVEQCAPMLAEVARLRGSARAAVRSLQEQDKMITTLEENNKQLRAKVTELTEKLSKYENVEVKLIEAETECHRLTELVSTDIPVLKEKLKDVMEEKRQLEIQCRQLKKSGRQSAVVTSGNKLTSDSILKTKT